MSRSDGLRSRREGPARPHRGRDDGLQGGACRGRRRHRARDRDPARQGPGIGRQARGPRHRAREWSAPTSTPTTRSGRWSRCSARPTSWPATRTSRRLPTRSPCTSPRTGAALCVRRGHPGVRARGRAPRARGGGARGRQARRRGRQDRRGPARRSGRRRSRCSTRSTSTPTSTRARRSRSCGRRSPRRPARTCSIARFAYFRVGEE